MPAHRPTVQAAAPALTDPATLHSHVRLQGVVRRLLVLTFVVFGLSCSSALGAFPGRNGELAVQPLRGGGIVLVQPGGGPPTRICADALLCGRPVVPRFSPNGRGIVFEDGNTQRVGIVAPNGTCLWCLLGRPLTTDRGSRPAFATDDTVSLVRRGSSALDLLPISGGKVRRFVAGRVSDGVSSSTGDLAVVRGAWIYVRPAHGKPRRLIRGGSPSWSPAGRLVVFARGGWVWKIADQPNAKAQRLRKGTAPAFSPDGRRIAYVGSGGRLYTMAADGRSVSRVGNVLGRSVDWQPIPRHVSPCSTGRGSIVGRSGTGNVRQLITGGSGPGGSISWNGCLGVVGQHHVLSSGPHSGVCYAFLDLSAIAVTGRYGAMSFHDCDHELPSCSDSVEAYNLGTGSGSSLLNSAENSCQYTIDSVRVDSSGFVAWHEKTSIGLGFNSLDAISCPSTTLCVTADDKGNVLTSTDPATGSWTTTPLAGAPQRGIEALSCPTTSFCLGTTSGGVFTTTDPTGGTGAWTFAPVSAVGTEGPSSASCPSATFCALTFDAGANPHATGSIFVSFDPSGGSSTWSGSYTSSQSISGLSCPSASFCAAADENGDVITSSNPAGGPSTWTVSKLGGSSLGAITCPSEAFCLAEGDVSGELFTSTNPAGGAAAWTPLELGGSQFLGELSCASSSLCLATGGGPQVYTSTDPAGGAAGWTRAAPPGPAVSASGVSCPTTSLCAMVTADGRALVSTDPAMGASSYTNTPIDGSPCFLAGTACEAESLYVHDDHGTRVIDSAPYGTGTVIGGLRLAGNSLTLTWTHAGHAHSLRLR